MLKELGGRLKILRRNGKGTCLRYWDLLSEQHCEKLFCLMESFWEAIASANIDFSWQNKVEESLLHKMEKEQEKIKQKMLLSLSRTSSLKKMVFK